MAFPTRVETRRSRMKQRLGEKRRSEGQQRKQEVEKKASASELHARTLGLGKPPTRFDSFRRKDPRI